MATTYNHAQIGVVDASGNVNVIYPQTYASDVVIEQNSNTYLTDNNITLFQQFAQVAGSDIQFMKEIAVRNAAPNHNALYRGIDLTGRSWCSANADGTITSAGLTELCSRISAGTFEDIYIGDYFKVNMTTPASQSGITFNGGAEVVTCVIAECDPFLGCGDTELTSHHCGIVPMYCFSKTHQMNSTGTSGVSTTANNPVGTSKASSVQRGAYLGSDMHQLVLPVYSSALASALTVGSTGHLITHKEILSNAMNANTPSRGYSAVNGASSGWEWASCTVELLSEPQVYGSSVRGNFYDVGINKTQLALFRHNPALIIGHLETSHSSRQYWWLRAVSGSGRFANVDNSGIADSSYAFYSCGVRPLFLLA